MSPSMEKERVDHQVLNPVLSRTEPDRNTLAADQIRLDAFFGISVYKHLERCVGTHPEKLWVKIPNYFCLSAYDCAGCVPCGTGSVPTRSPVCLHGATAQSSSESRTPLVWPWWTPEPGRWSRRS